MPDDGLTSADRLVLALRGVRRRYRGEVIVLTGAALVIFVLALAGTGRWDAVPSAVSFALVAFALPILAGLVAWLRAPSLQRIARTVDRGLALQERLSSARDVLVLGHGPDPVGSALLDDAARHGQALSRFRLHVPYRLAFAIIAIAALAAGGLILLMPGEAPIFSGPAGPAELDAATLSTEQMEQVRELIAADAERLDSPYLEAVAASLSRLGDTATHLPPEEHAERLRGLLEHAAAAYGAVRPGWLPRNPSDLSAVAAGLDRQRLSSALAANEAGGESVPLPDEWDMSSLDPTRRGPEALQDFLTQNRGGAPIGPVADNGVSGLAGGSVPALKDFEARPLDAQKMLSVSRAGVSLNADRGDSNAAGQGSRPLGDVAALPEILSGNGAELALTAERTGKGNLIRVEVAPSTQFTEVGAAVVAGSGGAAMMASALPVSRTAVLPDDRAIIARFFARQEPAASIEP